MRDEKRNTLKLFALAASAPPLSLLTSCSAADVSGSDHSQNAHTPDTAPSIATSDWLLGNTDDIATAFPGDDVFAADTTCPVKLFPKGIEGPCYFHVEQREDISEGMTGLPMQVCLQVIDEQCHPLSDYHVEIWHCDTRGIYSGDISNSSDTRRFRMRFCTDNDQLAKSARWGRGELISDSMGRVNFKSIFPGWYPGRTAHIHFRVKRGDRASLISQLRFTDSLCREIYTQHASYSERGNQDTSIADDFEFSSNDTQGFSLRQNSDGSLLAVKQIQLKA